MSSAIVEVIAVTSVLGVLGAMLFMLAKDADQLMRMIIRLELLPFPRSTRKWLATTFPRLGYYYFGTSGDKEQDRRIRHRARLAGRVFVVLTVGGVVFMFLFAIFASVLA